MTEMSTFNTMKDIRSLFTHLLGFLGVFIHRTCNGDNGKWINVANEKLPFHKEKGGAWGRGGGGYSLKERGRWQFWPSHSCVSLVETRCHHLVSSLPCRDHRRLPRRLPPAPGPGRAGTLPTDRKGSCHYTTHWEYTANWQNGFLPRWDSANRQKGFSSLHNTLGILCQQTERVPIITQHTGNTLPTDRKGSHHYTTHWEYTANGQKGFPSHWDSANWQNGFPSLHNTGNTHLWRLRHMMLCSLPPSCAITLWHLLWLFSCVPKAHCRN